LLLRVLGTCTRALRQLLLLLLLLLKLPLMRLQPLKQSTKPHKRTKQAKLWPDLQTGLDQERNSRRTRTKQDYGHQRWDHRNSKRQATC
jgi:hypothetical protein